MDKNREIHRLRGIAISAVVLIHVVNLALLNIEFSMTYQTIHTLLQFAVPCFIFISSLVFAMSMEGKTFRVGGYCKKKLVGVVIPYVVWTIVYLLPQMILGHIPFDRLFNPGSWFYWIVYGKAYTHLYFMSVIIQFYIVAPIMYYAIKWICGKVKKYQWLVMTLVIILPQVAIYWINRLYIYQYFKSTATLFPWYWCISILGFWIGINYKAWQEKFDQYKIAYIGGFAISLIAYMIFNVRMWYKLPIDTFVYQMIWYSYVIAATLVAFYIATKMKNDKAIKWLDSLAEYSFEIYLIHPLFTFVLSRIVRTENYLVLALVIVIGYFGIVKICCWISKILRGYKLFSWTVGTYEPIQKVNEDVVELQG